MREESQGALRHDARQAVLDFGRDMPRQFKIVVEKHSDGYVAYPLGMKGTVVGEGNTRTPSRMSSQPFVSTSKLLAKTPSLTNLH